MLKQQLIEKEVPKSIACTYGLILVHIQTELVRLSDAIRISLRLASLSHPLFQLERSRHRYPSYAIAFTQKNTQIAYSLFPPCYTN